MQISLHRTRNTKQVMRGHNIVGDRWVGAASHHPNSRTTLEMLDNLSKTLKLPQYLATSGQLSQCKNHWNIFRKTIGILQGKLHGNRTTLGQLEDNFKTILGQIQDNPRTNKATSRTTKKKLKDNSDNFRTTPWTFLRQLGQLQDNKNNSRTTFGQLLDNFRTLLRQLEDNSRTNLGHFQDITRTI